MKYIIKKKGEKDVCHNTSWGWVVWKPTTYQTKAEAQAVLESKVAEGKWNPDEAVITEVGDYTRK